MGSWGLGREKGKGKGQGKESKGMMREGGATSDKKLPLDH